MWRHARARRELKEQIASGRIGDILAMRTYRMHGPIASFASEPNPKKVSDLLYQIQRFHSFLWASGGCYSDFYIHSIDECCWMKDAWPVQAQANGGRHYRGNSIDQNFDNYSVEYTFADGAKLFLYGRCITGGLRAVRQPRAWNQGPRVDLRTAVSSRGKTPPRPRSPGNPRNRPIGATASSGKT